jgi:hypothetical protein
MKRSVQLLNAAKSLTCCGIVSAAIAVAGTVGKPAVSVAGSTAALMLIYDAALTTAEARPGGRAGRPHRGGRHVSPRRGRYDNRKRAKRRHKHRRRVIRRRHILGFLYVASLPHGCVTTVTLDGIRYYHCGSVYYRPYVDNGTTIYVIKE